MKNISKTKIILFFLLSTFVSFSQRPIRGPIWIPRDSTSILGLCVELNAKGDARSCTVYGVNVEFFGSGILLPLAPAPIIRENKWYVDSVIRQERSLIINGINISPFGLCTNATVNGITLNGIGSVACKVNGIQIACVANAAQVANGIQLTFFGNQAGYLRGIQVALANDATIASHGLQIGVTNHAIDYRGVQLGLFNRSNKLKGLQIGLWNSNGKRKLPLINW